MAISENAIKLLWARAAGFCSNPACENDLTVILREGNSFNIGEMAHVIAKSPNGPRGVPEGGSDEYENLILLCPTCHKKIDKAPDGEYPADLLLRWKTTHEAKIRSAGRQVHCSSLEELKAHISILLAENNMLFRQFGPECTAARTDPGSNLYRVWSLRKLDRIIPNNEKIINIIEANINLLSPSHLEAFFLFKAHATGFEENQYGRLDSYPMFPLVFAEAFRI